MITFAYITCRKEPKFEWYADGLRKQLYDAHLKYQKYGVYTPFQLIIVDLWKEERELKFENDIGVEVLHTLPLPSVWQGKYQITKEPYYAGANARNTALVYAKYPHIAYCDDLSVLGEHWLEGVMDAVKNNYVGLGAYNKLYDMEVKDGVMTYGDLRNDGLDSRWRQCPDNWKAQVDGSFFFGCSFCFPLEAALSVNGFDCITDGLGYEDLNIGLRLQKTGIPFFYDKRMLTYESNDRPQTDFVVKREDPILGEERYKQVLSNFGLTKSVRHKDETKDASHILLEVAHQKQKAAWNFFDLRELREKAKRGEEITLEDMKYPDKRWTDDKPLTEI